MLEFYKNYDRAKHGRPFELGCFLLIFNAIETALTNPTDEEFKVISSVCYEAWLKSDPCCDVIRLADNLSEAYANKEITLEEIKMLSKRQVLECFAG